MRTNVVPSFNVLFNDSKVNVNRDSIPPVAHSGVCDLFTSEKNSTSTNFIHVNVSSLLDHSSSGANRYFRYFISDISRKLDENQ